MRNTVWLCSVSYIAWPDPTTQARKRSRTIQRSLHGVLDCCRRRRRRRQSLHRLVHDDHVGGSLVVQTPGTTAASPCYRNTGLHVANWACCRPSRPRALADDPSAIAQPLVSTNRAIQALPMPIDSRYHSCGCIIIIIAIAILLSTPCPAVLAAAYMHSTAGPPNCRATVTGRVVSWPRGSLAKRPIWEARRWAIYRSEPPSGHVICACSPWTPRSGWLRQWPAPPRHITLNG